MPTSPDHVTVPTVVLDTLRARFRTEAVKGSNFDGNTPYAASAARMVDEIFNAIEQAGATHSARNDAARFLSETEPATAASR